jgi:cyclophilin family peptidyl-prolyl cis-trans isomerase
MPLFRRFRRDRVNSSSRRRHASRLRIEPLENRVLLHHDPAHTLTSQAHSQLTIYFDGQRQAIPANVGASGQHGTGAQLTAVHTHDTTGRLHVAPADATIPLDPPNRFPTLGDFFNVWRTQALAAGNNPSAFFNSARIMDRFADASHTVRFFVNGAVNTEYENYVLRDGDDLVISYDTIGPATRPSFVPIGDTTVPGGSPFHVALDGSDLQGGPLTYTTSVAIVSGNPQLSATIPQGNRGMRVRVQNFGDMLFQLFDDKAPRVTNRIANLANLDIVTASGAQKFYDGTIFHRVIDGFVIQGGDRTGGSPLGTFNDQFHVDLQHNRRGLLSMAKTPQDDSNTSQFFITDTPIPGHEPGIYARFLDFNHSVFGVLVEGENVRERISDVPIGSGDRPAADVRVESIRIVSDSENAVVMLSAPNDATGAADVTVTVRDSQGNSFARTFRVTVAADTFNGGPFLTEFPTKHFTTPGAPISFQLESIDVEGDPVAYATSQVPSGAPFTWTVNSTGLVTFTPQPAFSGPVVFAVGVAPQETSDTNDTFDVQVVTVVVAPSPTCAKADLNDDNVVSRTDLRVISQSLGAIVTAGTGADIDGDGRVSVRDLRWIRQFFGQSCPAPSAAAPQAAVGHAVGREAAIAPAAGLHVRRIDAVLARWERPNPEATITRVSIDPPNSTQTPNRPRLIAARRVASGQRAVPPMSHVEPSAVGGRASRAPQ